MKESERNEILRREAEREEKIRRRMEREERRRQQKLKRKSGDDEEEMNRRIAVEERKLLVAQRKLESIRLLDELLERVKVNLTSAAAFMVLVLFWKRMKQEVIFEMVMASCKQFVLGSACILYIK